MFNESDGYTVLIQDNFDKSKCQLHTEMTGVSVVEAMVRCMEAMTFGRDTIKQCMQEVLEDM